MPTQRIGRNHEQSFEAQLNFGRFSALGAAEKAVSRIASFVERYPIVYAPWLGFARRVIAGAYLRLERIDEAAAEARACRRYLDRCCDHPQEALESRQVAKSFLTLIQCEQALDQNDAVLSTFKRALDLLRIPLSVNPKPLEPTISAMMNLVRDIDPEAFARILRDELHFSTKN